MLQAPSGLDDFLSATLTVENQDRTVLNFDSMDTLEGELKAKVLEAGNSEPVAASGSKTHGVVGMAGTGKTVAIIGLSTQGDIKARVKHGIYFMSFGQEATEKMVVQEITKIIKAAGGV